MCIASFSHSLHHHTIKPWIQATVCVVLTSWLDGWVSVHSCWNIAVWFSRGMECMPTLPSPCRSQGHVTSVLCSFAGPPHLPHAYFESGNEVYIWYFVYWSWPPWFSWCCVQESKFGAGPSHVLWRLMLLFPSISSHRHPSCTRQKDCIAHKVFLAKIFLRTHARSYIHIFGQHSSHKSRYSLDGWYGANVNPYFSIRVWICL